MPKSGRPPAHLIEPHERLKWARARYYGSAAAAANAFGWNENTYKSTESGIRGLTRHKAERYGAALNVSWQWLLTGQGDPDRPMSPDEIDLLEKYRRLRHQEKQAVMGLVSSLAPAINTVHELAG